MHSAFNQSTLLMKRTSLAVAACLLLSGCAGITQTELFSRVLPATDPAYGFTPEKAIRLGHFDRQDNIRASHLFLSGLQKNGRPLNIVGRSSRPDPVNQPGGTFMRFGSGISGGILDAYQLVPEGTGDTLTLYIDIYHEEPLYIPQGLTFTPPRPEE